MTPARTARLRRTVQTLLLLLAVGVTLRLADCGPRAASRARDVRELPSLEAAEHAARRHLALPAWYPKSLPWPPARVLVVGAGPDAVALQLGGPDGGSPEVVLAQSFEGSVPLPPEFFPPALVVDARPVQLPRGPARLTRLRGDDGAAWHELAWEQEGRHFTFRSRGSVEQLFDLAISVRWEGRE